MRIRQICEDKNDTDHIQNIIKASSRYIRALAKRWAKFDDTHYTPSDIDDLYQLGITAAWQYLSSRQERGLKTSFKYGLLLALKSAKLAMRRNGTSQMRITGSLPYVVPSDNYDYGGKERQNTSVDDLTYTNTDDFVDKETVKYILDIAINHNLGKILKNSEKYKNTKGGPMTGQELRCIIRVLGPLGSDYPGKGKMRENINIPRDAKNWWQPGEDPEIEPIPDGGVWNSIWSRSGYPSMFGQPSDIANEFAEEVQEFQKLGIPTARLEKSKSGAVMTRTAIHTTIKSALNKFTIIKDIHRYELGLDESIVRSSPFDRWVIAKTCGWMIDKLNGSLT